MPFSEMSVKFVISKETLAAELADRVNPTFDWSRTKSKPFNECSVVCAGFVSVTRHTWQEGYMNQHVPCVVDYELFDAFRYRTGTMPPMDAFTLTMFFPCV